MRRFQPSEQQSDYFLGRRTDALNRNAHSNIREFLVPVHAKHLDRFRAEPGRTRSDELRYEQMEEWYGED